jgi:hypothetical protein
MKKLVTSACAAAIALGGAAAPGLASAAPVVPRIKTEAANPNLTQVEYRGDKFRWRGGNPYWRGHRGYKHRRSGFSNHNGWWFPAGAFIAGAIISGALSQPRYYEEPRVIYQPRRVIRRASGAHVNWCYNRYRSYREWDNSFQPYHGPRQQCYSPYS